MTLAPARDWWEGMRDQKGERMVIHNHFSIFFQDNDLKLNVGHCNQSLTMKNQVSTWL